MQNLSSNSLAFFFSSTTRDLSTATRDSHVGGGSVPFSHLVSELCRHSRGLPLMASRSEDGTRSPNPMTFHLLLTSYSSLKTSQSELIFRSVPLFSGVQTASQQQCQSWAWLTCLRLNRHRRLARWGSHSVYGFGISVYVKITTGLYFSDPWASISTYIYIVHICLAPSLWYVVVPPLIQFSRQYKLICVHSVFGHILF